MTAMLEKVSNLLKTKQVLSLAANVLSAGVAFLSFSLLAHFFEPEDLGVWMLYLTGYSFMEMIKAGMLQSALIKFTSGNTADQEREYIGSGWVILSTGTFLLAILLWAVKSIFYVQLSSSAWIEFFNWYPWVAMAMLPQNMALWVMQARQEFMAILKLRMLNTLLFLVLVVSIFVFKLSINEVFIGNFLLQLVSSIYAMLSPFAAIKSVASFQKDKAMQLLHYGKFHIAAFLGTNLLKSADTFLVNFFLGPAAVAVYAVPLRLSELNEIPVRALTSTAMPAMSAAHNRNDKAAIAHIFFSQSGLLTLALLPLQIFAMFFAAEIIQLTAGEAYSDAVPLLRIFLLYGIFLSADRFSGIALDAINLPKINMIKVFLMATANVIGDLVVIKMGFGLVGVAWVTILNAVVGIGVGWYFLGKKVDLSWPVLVASIKPYFSSLQIQLKRF